MQAPFAYLPTGTYFDSTPLQRLALDPPAPTVACYTYVGELKHDHPKAVDLADFPEDDAIEVFFCSPQDLRTADQRASQAELTLDLVSLATLLAITDKPNPDASKKQEDNVNQIRNLDFPACARNLRWLYYQAAKAYHDEYPYAALHIWTYINAYNQFAKAYEAAIQSERTYLDQLLRGEPPKPHPAVPTPTPIPPYLR